MKKLLAVICLAALTPFAFAEDGGALSIVTPAQNIRLPQAQADGDLATFQVKNIQVQAKWSITPESFLSIDGGTLRLIEGTERPTGPVAFQVKVEDNFKLLNSQYDNLAAVAVITVEISPGMFLMGGYNSSNARLRDVWGSSNNGKDWSIRKTPGWSGRYGHSVVKHNGKIYVIGGYDGSRKKDVWLSPDGETWSNLGNAPWNERRGHQSVVHNGRIYVLGGSASVNGSTQRVKDVWSSADGITWSRSPDPGWGGREDAAAVVYNGVIYVMGGETGGSAADSQVWSSGDGENWTSRGDAGWSRRYGHRAVVHNNKIYVIGGTFQSSYYKDVWEWTGSGSWVNKGNAPWAGRDSFGALLHNDLLYVIGGLVSTNDVWSSSDGQSWTIVSGTKFLPARSGTRAVVFP